MSRVVLFDAAGRKVQDLRAGEGRSAVGACFLDASGRKVMEPRPGANDVGGQAPGVYFVHLAAGARDGAAAVARVVVAR